MRPRLKQIERVGTNGQILSWNEANDIWAPRDYIWGDDFHYAESLGSSSNSGSTWSQKLRLTTSSLSAGDYMVVWSYARGGYYLGWPEQRIQIDDTTTPHTSYTGRHDVAANRNVHMGMFKVTLTSGVHTIDLDHRIVDDTLSYSYIEYARLALWRIPGTWSPSGAGTVGPIRPKQFAQDGASYDDIITRGSSIWGPDSRKVFGTEYQQNESLGESSTSSGAYQQKLRLSTTSLPAGDYFVMVNWQFSGDNDQVNLWHRFQLDDTTTIYEEPSSLGSKNSSEDRWITGGLFDVLTLTSGTHTFDLDYSPETGSTTQRIKDARICLWRKS